MRQRGTIFALKIFFPLWNHENKTDTKVIWNKIFQCIFFFDKESGNSNVSGPTPHRLFVVTEILGLGSILNFGPKYVVFSVFFTLKLIFGNNKLGWNVSFFLQFLVRISYVILYDWFLLKIILLTYE